jgi:hypothetical protein
MKMELTDEALEAVKAKPDDALLVRWAIMKKHLDPKLKKAGELVKARLASTGELVGPNGERVFLKDKLGPREFKDAEAKATAWEHVA